MGDRPRHPSDGYRLKIQRNKGSSAPSPASGVYPVSSVMNATLVSREKEMQKSIAVYHALIDIHQRNLDHLRERRRGATDSVMVEIDERLEAQERLIASLRRAIDATESQLLALRNSSNSIRP
jgi:hypothetical protein